MCDLLCVVDNSRVTIGNPHTPEREKEKERERIRITGNTRDTIKIEDKTENREKRKRECFLPEIRLSATASMYGQYNFSVRFYSDINIIKTNKTAAARWGVRLQSIGSLGNKRREGEKKTTEGASVCVFVWSKKQVEGKWLYPLCLLLFLCLLHRHTRRKTRVDEGRGGVKTRGETTIRTHKSKQLNLASHSHIDAFQTHFLFAFPFAKYFCPPILLPSLPPPLLPPLLHLPLPPPHHFHLQPPMQLSPELSRESPPPDPPPRGTPKTRIATLLPVLLQVKKLRPDRFCRREIELV